VELKPGYKQTEVGVIPAEWDIVHLSDLLDFRNGVNADKRAYGKGTPFVNVLEVITHSHIRAVDIPGRVSVSRSARDLYSVRRGDLVFNRTSETQEEVGLSAVYVDDEPVVFGGFVIRGRPKTDSLDADYSGYALRARSIRSQVIAKGQGAIRANIGQADLRQVLAPRPPLSQQRAIATTLGDVDALLRTLTQLIAKKRDLKQAAMQKLLTGQTRLPGFREAWEERPLGSEIVGLDAGVSVNSGDNEAASSSEELAILKTSAVANGVFLPHECKNISANDVHRARLNPRANSILISRMNTIDLVGECGYVDADYFRLFVPDRLWMTRFRPESTVSVRWLSYVLSSAEYRHLLKAIATGTSGSMKNISKTSLLSLPIVFPGGEEQTAIAAVLSDMDAELAALEQRLAKTRVLKQGMMQELLAGRTRLV